MQTIKVDDSTYNAWKQQADAYGLTIEEWLKQQTTTSEPEADQRKPEELTLEEWQARFDHAMNEIEKMNLGSEYPVDWSRETIYEDRGL